MRRNPFAVLSLLAMLLLLAAGLPAHATSCTAGNPNAFMTESTPTSDFTSLGVLVIHLRTGLMWKACAEGQTLNVSCVGAESSLSWADALKAANTANTTPSIGYGFTDWRLPNKKELESIVESCGYNPSFNLDVFPAYSSSNFWSSSTYVNDPTLAWGVGFGDGGTFAGTKTDGNHVRLVRGGNGFGSFDRAHLTASVIYDGNGSTGGSVPTDSNAYAAGATVNVLGNTGGLVRPRNIFAGWNTHADGSGTSYAGGATFIMGSSNVILYARWIDPSFLRDVTYNGNGSTGGSVPTDGNVYLAGETVTVLGNTGNLVKTHYIFAGWNTAANGSGTSYAGGATFTMGSSNVTLYAKWVINITPILMLLLFD